MTGTVGDDLVHMSDLVSGVLGQVLTTNIDRKFIHISINSYEWYNEEFTLSGLALRISTIFLPLSCPMVSPLPSSLFHPDEVEGSDLSHSSSSYVAKWNQVVHDQL
jgi:hypothetical protein